MRKEEEMSKRQEFNPESFVGGLVIGFICGVVATPIVIYLFLSMFDGSGI